MAKKQSLYPTPSHYSKTRQGTPPNATAKNPIPGSGKNRPAKGYDPLTKTWNQK